MKKAGVNKKTATLMGVALVLVALAIWTIWGNAALLVNEITVYSNRLPASFSGFRIAHISDLHNAEFGKENATLLRMLSDCKPDAIVITGDLVDAYHADVEIATHFAKESGKIAPTYYVTGNHEASLFQYSELRERLKAAGVVVLQDELIHLEKDGESMVLLGLDDPNFTMKTTLLNEVPAMIGARIKNMLEQENDYSVLLSHRPELFEVYVSCGVDLVLSGHAHGGQFRLPFVGGVIAPDQGLFPQYDAGLYTDGNTNMIVSRGLGNSIIPIRFNNRPEIVLIELKAQ